jgi:hypothetical protein
MSDHNPLIMDTGEKPMIKSAKFSFKKDWLNHPEFNDIVKKAWNSVMHNTNNISNLQLKLKKVKYSLKGWGNNIKGDIEKI